MSTIFIDDLSHVILFIVLSDDRVNNGQNERNPNISK